MNINTKEKIVDKLLNQTHIEVDGKVFKVKNGETLQLETIGSYLLKRLRDGKKL